jgi:UDP-GlcNAc:undecaprenyl-phosphate GlcNAc-1-phosphate transferase
MSSLWILALSAFSAAFILTPLARDLAISKGWVDEPDRVRKFHRRPIPRVGGVAVFLAYIVALIVFFLCPFPAHLGTRGQFEIVRRLFPAAFIVFAIGLLDDLLQLGPWPKLAGQVAAACVAVLSGLHIKTIGGHPFAPALSNTLTVLWLVGCTNAFNLIDGMDGLASGVGLLATTSIFLAALIAHNFAMAVAVAPLIGALLGFLCFNFSPASIFLGDSGSLFVGFLLGCFGILWCEKSATILSMTAPLIALSIPLLDTGLSILRRFLRCQPLLRADHGHIHHRLLARGLTPRRAVVVIYTVCAACGALSLLQSFADNRFGGLVIFFLCIGACVGVEQLGYAEFQVARSMILDTKFRRLLNAQLRLNAFHEELSAAVTGDECWDVLQRSYSSFGFTGIRFQFGGRLYTDTKHSAASANTWTVRIRLSNEDYVNFTREIQAETLPVVARFTDLAGRILSPKAEDLQTLSAPIDISMEGDVTRASVVEILAVQ